MTHNLVIPSSLPEADMCRQRAAECRLHASKANSDDVKAIYEKLAQKWSLIAERDDALDKH
jgi:hypothetical protein